MFICWLRPSARMPSLGSSSRLARRYVQYINTTYRRTGTLWDSRYKSSLIQAETCLPSCQRYIQLNPVRAALVDDPAHTRWTSYRHHALGQTNPCLTPHPLYLAIGRGDAERQAAYRDLFRAQLDNKAIDDMRLALNQNPWTIRTSMHRSKR